MKRLTTLLFIVLATITLTAQDREHKFNFMVFTEPVAYKDGLNFGADLEYEMQTMYFKVGFFTFPNLHNVGYTQIHGSVGVTVFRPNRFDNHRAYIGILGGTNFREGNPNYIYGFEAGVHIYPLQLFNINWKAKDTFFMRFNLSYIERGDAEFYGGSKWMHNGDVGIGFKFN